MIRQLRLVGLSIAVTAAYGLLLNFVNVEPAAAEATTVSTLSDAGRVAATDPIRVADPELGVYAIDLAEATLEHVRLESPVELRLPPLPVGRATLRAPCGHGFGGHGARTAV